jgi:hypothetical protein
MRRSSAATRSRNGSLAILTRRCAANNYFDLLARPAADKPETVTDRGVLPAWGLAPAGDGFADEPGLGIMLRETWTEFAVTLSGGGRRIRTLGSSQAQPTRRGPIEGLSRSSNG